MWPIAVFDSGATLELTLGDAEDVALLTRDKDAARIFRIVAVRADLVGAR